LARLIIVSNRVGSSLKANDGGLATAILAAVESEEVVWFGWSGEVVEDAASAPRVQRDGRLMRVLIDLRREDYEGYYLHFANRVLWPLAHYRVGLVEFRREEWAAYRRVNDLIAEQIAAMLLPDDLVWVHDYHLIPLAAALRRLGVANRVGFFLHIPFPASEVLVTLPVAEALMRALFAYDLVGLQTDADALAFCDYVEREAEGWLSDSRTAHAYGTQVRFGAFPIGVDAAAIGVKAARAAGMPQAVRLRNSLSGRPLMIGVDRLDYSKGLIHRFAALERLFDAYPARRDAAVLQIAPPTREEVPEYQQIRTELDAAIGRINGRFGELDRLPVRYLNRRFRQEVLFGFYRASRVAIVTPLRDGMNLVAKEYVASQDPTDPGVLVLSRFAGAARQLEAATIVNPFDIDAVAEALERALAMPLDERRERYAAMIEQLRQHGIHAWRTEFLDALRWTDATPAIAKPGAAVGALWH